MFSCIVINYYGFVCISCTVVQVKNLFNCYMYRFQMNTNNKHSVVICITITLILLYDVHPNHELYQKLKLILGYHHYMYSLVLYCKRVFSTQYLA